jgi:hypothetical protein
MNIKTKLFSLIILSVLVLPVFINPPKSGGVLGAFEDKNVETQSQTSPNSNQISTSSIGSVLLNQNKQEAQQTENQVQEQSSGVKLKDISSGIRDIKKKVNAPIELRGKIIWDANTKSSAVSDKFALGAGVRVAFNGKSTDVVIGDNRVLSPDTIMIVDQKTFILMGGNPELQQSIDVMASLE